MAEKANDIRLFPLACHMHLYSGMSAIITLATLLVWSSLVAGPIVVVVKVVRGVQASKRAQANRARNYSRGPYTPGPKTYHIG